MLVVVLMHIPIVDTYTHILLRIVTVTRVVMYTHVVLTNRY